MNTFRIIKTAATDVATTSQTGAAAARIGVLQLSKEYTLPTPNFIISTSRGVVPHLSPDNLERNTNVQGVWVSLEDFIEKAPQRSPPIYTSSSTLRAFISLPSPQFIILSARRSPPIVTPKPNSNDTLSILTSVGFRDLPIKDYVSSISQLQPDVVISVADIPNSNGQLPGKNRIPKMPFRTELWLKELLSKFPHNSGNLANIEKNGEKVHEPAVFAQILPIDPEKQRVYIDTLVDEVDKLTGLVLPSRSFVSDLPAELQNLIRLIPDISDGPHSILDDIAGGIDIFNVNFTGLATDAGIALHFVFGASSSPPLPPPSPADSEVLQLENNRKLELGTDMWDSAFAADLSPLMEGCTCYTCRKHHKAFIQHCLNAKEMTAWVLLQIHNIHVLDTFFASIRNSITAGTFNQDQDKFEETYRRDLPERTGQGPRIRGYQYKSTGIEERRLNDPAYRALETNAPEEDEKLNEDSETLVRSGFAEKTDQL